MAWYPNVFGMLQAAWALTEPVDLTYWSISKLLLGSSTMYFPFQQKQQIPCFWSRVVVLYDTCGVFVRPPENLPNF